MRNVFLAALLTIGLAQAEDWPQWLGPNRDGTFPGKMSPWTGDLKVNWRINVGEGNSSPVVAGGLVFIHSKVKDKDAEIVQAFDATTGKLKWEQSYDKPTFKPLFGAGPRSTPCVHDGMLYTLGNTGRLNCFEAATGKPVWNAEVLAEPVKHNLMFGLSASPLVVGDLVVVLGGSKASPGVKAFDRKTGKLAWTASDDPASYAAPVQFGDEIVALTGAHLLSVSKTGEVRWKFPFRDALNESSTTPIKVGDFYVAASVTAGAVGVKVETKDGKPAATAAWRNPKLTCYFSTPMPIDANHMYLVTGAASLTDPTITLRCVEVKTGKEIWSEPKLGKYHAALLKSGCGNLLLHTDDGQLRFLAPNPTKYEEKAKSKVCGPTWAHPAVVGKTVYVRDGKELIAVELN